MNLNFLNAISFGAPAHFSPDSAFASRLIEIKKQKAVTSVFIY